MTFLFKQGDFQVPAVHFSGCKGSNFPVALPLNSFTCCILIFPVVVNSFLHVHFLTTTVALPRTYMKEICLPDGDLQPDPTVTWMTLGGFDLVIKGLFPSLKRTAKAGPKRKLVFQLQPFSGGKRRLVSFREGKWKKPFSVLKHFPGIKGPGWCKIQQLVGGFTFFFLNFAPT